MPHIICCEKKMMSTINGDEKYKTKTNTNPQEVSRRISIVLNAFFFQHLFLKGLYTNQFKLPYVNVQGVFFFTGPPLKVWKT